MAINWQDQEVKDRILAAIIASYDGAINCREVARIYGDGATYNAIENFLRKPKRKAAEMKAEANGREAPAPSPSRPRAPRSPGKSVKTGRVAKSTPAKKGAGGSPLKKSCVVDDADDDVFGGGKDGGVDVKVEDGDLDLEDEV
ncbi:hypothetical protein P280DRAFT_509479 [Massarina eburnea CBS 473.64]|uniref:Uncharacterized protein n=1 Tax=Massarina eburnea CBS 473.64 TaxID=1395130 RepID=A0A6A6RQP5_9PLEO|nr:hypothetical protein P280DRAFT_509479 [Massarina eburnea CBS 473.64]